MGDDLVPLFMKIGLTEQKAKETAKNKNLSKNLACVIPEAANNTGDLTACGTLLYTVASKTKPQVFHFMPLLVKYICGGKLDNELRLNAALEFLSKMPPNKTVGDVDLKVLDEACGVGVVISPAQIEEAVEDELLKVKEDLLKSRYRFNTGVLMGVVRNKLKWADGKAIKSEIDMQVLNLLGPKTDEDLAPVKKQKNQGPKEEKKASKPTNNPEEETEGAATISELMKNKVHFHAPGANHTTDGYLVTPDTERLLSEHLKRTNGQVRTRFPPEPNGILHIGHAKAININFGYAKAYDGITFLRYDDTNPEKEEERFFVGILDMVTWLGYKPYKITHSSDYFDQLYDMAVHLIEKDLAYVCHQKLEDIRGFNPPPSPYRNRPIAESLSLFEDMKNGIFDEGEATLRMKITLEEGKQDPVAYRIKYVAHHRTGDKWCIYPTYDYTHCLCDSIEDITHSLCTKEFQARRSSYYWLCNSVDVYSPVQWEYGRLSVYYTVVSKRKIGKLIETGVVSDWDDPRLFTLTALRRRGFPAEAINNFCAKMGVTGAQAAVDPMMLEASVRDHLNLSAPRTMVVLDPLKVTILNLDKVQKISVPDFPSEPERGSHDISFSNSIYIERSDFKSTEEKGYRRLSPGQSVGLRYAGYVITLVEAVQEKGEVVELRVNASPIDAAEKPKAFIHWASSPIDVEVRLYSRLFEHRNPEDANEVPGGFLTDIRQNTLVVKMAKADKYIKEAKVYDRFQFERNGFFAVDRETTKDKLVFNLTVGLKEDAGK